MNEIDPEELPDELQHPQIRIARAMSYQDSRVAYQIVFDQSFTPYDYFELGAQKTWRIIHSRVEFHPPSYIPSWLQWLTVGDLCLTVVIVKQGFKELKQ